MAAIPSGSNRTGLLSRRQTGAGFESKARAYLERAGLTFVAANVQIRGGELDLIMREGATLVFVEVRYRRSAAYGNAATSVTAAKQSRLLHAALVWLTQHNGSFDTVDCRFDVLAFTGSDTEWLPNAFTANGQTSRRRQLFNTG